MCHWIVDTEYSQELVNTLPQMKNSLKLKAAQPDYLVEIDLKKLGKTKRKIQYASLFIVGGTTKHNQNSSRTQGYRENNGLVEERRQTMA